MKSVELASPEERERLRLARVQHGLWMLALSIHNRLRGPVYQQTVPVPVINDRRRRNRVARNSRRLNRIHKNGSHH